MGFPSPADEYVERRLRLDDLVVPQEATYFLRVKSPAMEPTLCRGDVLVVDRALLPLDAQVAVVVYKNHLLTRRVITYEDHVRLVADNPAYREIVVLDLDAYQVWGVATYCLRQVNRRRCRTKLVRSLIATACTPPASGHVTHSSPNRR